MYGSGSSILAILAAVLVFGVLLFFLCRFLLLWYFRINERVELLKEQNEILERIEKSLSSISKRTES